MNIMEVKVRKPIFEVLLLSLFLTAFLSVGLSAGEAAGKACAECHDEVTAAFGGSSHGLMKAKCTDCHGIAAKHLDNAEAGNIIGFKNETALQKSKQCLNCHQKEIAGFMKSEHARSGTACTTCHKVHKKPSSPGKMGTKLCLHCHQDVGAEFKLNERHRLSEGILECTSCHDPHTSAARQKIGAFKDESCLKCHRDKGGPFIYEHEAVREEGCAECHNVHGSPNRHMLKHQSVRELCFSCHAAAPSWHTRFLSNDTN